MIKDVLSAHSSEATKTRETTTVAQRVEQANYVEQKKKYRAAAAQGRVMLGKQGRRGHTGFTRQIRHTASKARRMIRAEIKDVA